MTEIKESGMLFRFDDDKVFPIEACALYQDRISQRAAKMAEMIAVGTRGEFIVIEAKSSSPQPDGKANEKLEEFIDAIVDKFANALQLFHAMALNYHGADHNRRIPSGMTQLVQSGKPAVRLVLVINGHPRKWMVPVQDMLVKKTATLCSLWRSEAVAINEDKARSLGLIV